MVEEIFNFFGLEFMICDVVGFEVVNYEISNRVEFKLFEEKIVLKLMEVFISMFSKYIMDVFMSNFEIVDYKIWIIELDKIDVYFDDNWRFYMEDWFYIFLELLRLNFNLF